MQASDFIFASATHTFDLIQYPIHRLLATGHLAAAWSFWVLKVVHLLHLNAHAWQE